MRKLVLASWLKNVAHRLGPVFGKPLNEVTMAVVTTALSGETGDIGWYTDERKVLQSLGLKLVDVDIEGRTSQELSNAMAGVDGVYVTGGNTYYLLYHARLTGFDKVVAELMDEGVVYLGTSAGTVLACPNVDIVRQYDDASVVPLTDYSGLGFVDFVILPHIDQIESAARRERTIRDWADQPYEVIGLTDYQALVCVGNYTTIIDATA